MVQQPNNMKVKLFPHQLSSIFMMENLELNNKIEKVSYFKTTKIGINSEITGFGKTLSMIGLIIRDKMEWNLDLPFVSEKVISESGGFVKNYYISRFDKLPTTLILVPINVLKQWKVELSKTNLKSISISTNKDLEELNIDDDYDVILVVPNFYNKLINSHSKFAWKRFIFDEPGDVTIPNMLECHAGFYWFITATPNVVVSKHRNCKGSFMRTLFGNLYTSGEEFINDIRIQNNPDFVKQSFIMPPVHHHHHVCHEPLYSAIRDFVTPMIKTMIEAGNIEDAIVALGGEKTSNILELIKHRKENELEEINMKILLYESRNDTNKIEEWKMKQTRLIDIISKINDKFRNFLNNECNICFEKFTDPVMEPGCQNIFCGECLFEWLQRNNTCPLCRIEIDPSSLIYIKNHATEKKNSEKRIRKISKNEKIIEILRQNPSGKFLIYSEYDNTFYPLKFMFYNENISFTELKGAIKIREKSLDIFKNGRVQVLFLNSSNSCAGINLPEATDIILCHQMNSDIEKQIIGRATRIGRNIELHVHHLEIL